MEDLLVDAGLNVIGELDAVNERCHSGNSSVQVKSAPMCVTRIMSFKCVSFTTVKFTVDKVNKRSFCTSAVRPRFRHVIVTGQCETRALFLKIITRVNNFHISDYGVIIPDLDRPIYT